MSNATTSRSRRGTSTPVIRDNKAFRFNSDPAYVAAVNHVANLKVLAAIRAGKLRRVPSSQTPPAGSHWLPRLDLLDDPSSSRVLALIEIPGVKKKDLSLSVRQSQITVLGTRFPPTQESLRRDIDEDDSQDVKKEEQDIDMTSCNAGVESVPVNASVQELRYGTFYRAIPIPPSIQESDVKASLYEGMLRISWPRVDSGPASLIPAIVTLSPTPPKQQTPN